MKRALAYGAAATALLAPVLLNAPLVQKLLDFAERQGEHISTSLSGVNNSTAPTPQRPAEIPVTKRRPLQEYQPTK
jgi:hypothetical protein